MTNLMEQVIEQMTWHVRYLHSVEMLRRAAEKIGPLLPGGTGTYVNASLSPGDSKIHIYADGAELGEIARALLPLVGEFKKNFDSSYGKFELTAVFQEIPVVITGTPPSTCQMEVEEEEVTIPAEEERTETRRRFVLKGDCDPLLAPREHEPAPTTDLDSEQ